MKVLILIVCTLATNLYAATPAEQPYYDKASNYIVNGQPEKAREILLPLANSGVTEAQIRIGSTYHGVDDKKKFDWYLKAAELGDSDAQMSVAVCYDRGDGVTKDKRLALHWYELSAQQGNPVALHNLPKARYKVKKLDEKENKK